MILELKHLAPYLPHNLKGRLYSEHNSPIATCELHGLDEDTVYLSDLYAEQSMEFFKPILRSLSDLTKEIEYNGQMFVPADKFSLGGCISTEWRNDDGVIHLYDDDNADETLGMIDPDNLDICEWSMVQQLFEWHFDVYGLIGKGLAINLKQE